MAPWTRTVFVLGAGFTKAFAPHAPLLIDDYYDEELAAKFEKFPPASHILKTERRLCAQSSQLNLERIWTRLISGMPYDRNAGQLSELLAEIKARFTARLESAKASVNWDDLKRFAAFCRANVINCITFNYDDFLDRALWDTVTWPDRAYPGFWDPQWGYAFVCNSTSAFFRNMSGPQRQSGVTMFLLKLHGSMNWRVIGGQPTPFAVVGSIMHHEEWWSPYAADHMASEDHRRSLKAMGDLLEPEPFIVPPILAKSALVEQPLLRYLWSKAYAMLQNAQQVVYIGYSLPATDMAAGTMFSEAFSHLSPTDVKVVDWGGASEEAKRKKTDDLLEAYSKVFPGITANQLDLRGGLVWARELLADDDTIRSAAGGAAV